MAKALNEKCKRFFAVKRNKVCVVIIIFVVIAGILAGILFSENKPQQISVKEAQTVIDSAYGDMINELSRNSAIYIASNSSATVNSISYGSNKEIYADCSIVTINAGEVLQKNIYELFSTDTLDNGRPIVSTKLKFLIDDTVLEYIKDEAEIIKKDYTITICDTPEGFKVYTNNEMVNECFGGIFDFQSNVKSTNSIKIDGKVTSIETNLKNGINECIQLNYSNQRPETATGLLKICNSIANEFYRNFIAHNYWQYITDGLLITLQVACFAVLVGVILGFIMAIIRCTYDKTGKLVILDKIAKLYLSVFRGTPVVVQLLIIYFVVFMPIGINQVVAAIICFGLNSGAYVCEIVRGGIMSVDNGQMEAGRSLGFNYVKTMWYIVIPQAFKAVLPALANEFIVLLKETSVVGYIGLNDLTRGGNIIKSKTYSAFMPLVIVAIIYLVIVVILSKLVGLLERRLRKSDRR